MHTIELSDREFKLFMDLIAVGKSTLDGNIDLCFSCIIIHERNKFTFEEKRNFNQKILKLIDSAAPY